jgi:hypothetical protein
VCSAYHYLLLYGDRLAAINQVSGKVVSEVSWGPGSHTPGIVGEFNLLLCSYAAYLCLLFYAYTCLVTQPC